MNIITVSKALRAFNDKARLLNERRKKAKDKSRWDAKNGDDLEFVIHQQTVLTEKLLEALRRQGQFEHAIGDEDLIGIPTRHE